MLLGKEASIESSEANKRFSTTSEILTKKVINQGETHNEFEINKKNLNNTFLSIKEVNINLFQIASFKCDIDSIYCHRIQNKHVISSYISKKKYLPCKIIKTF